MKTFIADIIPKIERFSKRLDDLTKLTNQHWVSLGDINQSKRVFIFRPNNQLLISDNGIVEKGSWEYLGNQTLLMDTKQESYLLKHGFFDENVIALKLDSTDSYAFFVNETKYHKELNNISDIIKFLSNKYLNGNTLSSKDTVNIEDIIIPNVSSMRNDKIIFADGTTTEVIKDIQGKYFIVAGYNRHYYSSQETAIRASYIYKVTKKITPFGRES
jgi:hypothetical protein